MYILTSANYQNWDRIRTSVAILTFSSVVSVSIGINVKASSASPPSPDLATEAFIQDAAHLSINIILCATMLFVLCPPIISMIFYSLGLSYGIRLYTAILSDHQGCGDPFFDNKRTRCWIQCGVSGCEILWSILLVIESYIALRKRCEKKSVRDVEESRGQLNANDTAACHGTVELTIVLSRIPSVGQDSGESEGEQPPKYTQMQLRDRSHIVDAAHPPEGLVNEAASILNSEATEIDLVATSASSAYIEQHAESSVIDMTAEELSPPPSYQP